MGNFELDIHQFISFEPTTRPFPLVDANGELSVSRGAPGAGVFVTLSRANHSCRPSSCFFFHEEIIP